MELGLTEYVTMAHKMRQIADAYAKEWSESYCCRCDPTFHIHNHTISFTIEPITSGMSTRIVVPASVLETPKIDLEQIRELIAEKKKQMEEDRKARTCSECGHYKQEWEFSAMGW